MMHLRFVVAAITLILLTGFVSACDDDRLVTVTNHSAEPVVVWADGVPVSLVEPRSGRSFVVFEFVATSTYEVRELCATVGPCEQRVLASATFTWDELKDLDPLVID